MVNVCVTNTQHMYNIFLFAIGQPVFVGKEPSTCPLAVSAD